MIAMPPLRLRDDELDAVMTAARPLDPDRRADFVQARAGEYPRGLVASKAGVRFMTIMNL